MVNKAKAVPLFLKGDEVLALEGDKEKPTRATTLLLFLEKEEYPEGGRWLKTHDCEPHHNWHKEMKWLEKPTRATTAHLSKGRCRSATEGIKIKNLS